MVDRTRYNCNSAELDKRYQRAVWMTRIATVILVGSILAAVWFHWWWAAATAVSTVLWAAALAKAVEIDSERVRRSYPKRPSNAQP